MQRILAAAGATALAATALAMSGPVTAHAQGTTGPCANGTQHQGAFSGHHSFTDSHNNCVQFNAPNDTAFLTDSNFNSIIFNGANNIVEDFKNSNSNTITFDANSTGNELNASNANNWTANFVGASNDFVDLLGTTATPLTMTIEASDVAIAFDSSCTMNMTVTNASIAQLGMGTGTESNPIVIC
jgi:hypothetical protein